VSGTKKKLLAAIMESLSQSLATLEKAARASHAEATHESSRAENKYDTRGLEAAYLAGGQARQARELLESIKHYESLTIRHFGKAEGVALGALVEARADGVSSFYFIGPRHGGLEIQVEGMEIMVITPQSPLGENLMGRKAGQRWTAKIGGGVTQCEIVSVL
jgi:transcription elongation GreA/GreB family factor